MVDVKENLGLLGLIVTDKVTHLKGVVTSMSFDLYGCVQALVNPGVDTDGKLVDCYWFDVSRLTVSKQRAMPLPEFALDKGPERKPAFH